MIPASARSVEVLIHVSTTGRVTLPAASRRRQMGIYYTPTSTADYMADWLLRGEADQVLEPSFGDGVFLTAVARVARRRGLDAVRVRGVEIDAVAASGKTVHLATFDLSADVLTAIKDGKMDFAIDQQQFLQGYLPIVILTNYAETKNLPTGNGQGLIMTGPGFVTQADAEAVIGLAAKGLR